MQGRKHKRKMNHVVIVTSDLANAKVKQYRIKPWVSWTIIFILCIIIGALSGYVYYEEQIWESVNSGNGEQLAMLQALEEEKKALEAEIEVLNDKVQILSNTVNEKTQSEAELAGQIERQSMPTEYPLTGSASMKEAEEGEPMCVFQASVGTMVVATASGKVLAVNEDTDYGHNIWIDHGNGYITIYRNKGDTTIKQGETVVQGATLFIIGEDNTQLGYQMMKDNEYINPMDMLEING